METSYERLAVIFKALSDETRLHIIDMLSCDELTAADILASFDLSQSTLSYHMRILTELKLVKAYRSGIWTKYAINGAAFEEVLEVLPVLYKTKDKCICAQIKYCRLEDAPVRRERGR